MLKTSENIADLSKNHDLPISLNRASTLDVTEINESSVEWWMGEDALSNVNAWVTEYEQIWFPGFD